MPSFNTTNELGRRLGDRYPCKRPHWAKNLTVQQTEFMDIDGDAGAAGGEPHPKSVSLILYPIERQKNRAEAPAPFGGGRVGKLVSLEGGTYGFDRGHLAGISLGGSDHHDPTTETTKHSRPSLTIVPQEARWQRNGLWRSVEERLVSLALAYMNRRQPFPIEGSQTSRPEAGIFVRVVISKEKYGEGALGTPSWHGDEAQEPLYYQFIINGIKFGDVGGGNYDKEFDITFVDGQQHILNIPCYRMMLEGVPEDKSFFMQHTVALPRSSVESTKLCYLDTETSGLDCRRNGIVELAWEVGRLSDAEPIEHYSSLHNPEAIGNGVVDYDPEATRVHGISSQAIATAPPITSSLEKMYHHDPEVLLAYNASFDLEFMLDAIGQTDLEFRPKPVLDVLKVVQLVYDLAKKHGKSKIPEFQRINAVHEAENSKRKEQYRTINPSLRLGKVYKAFFQRGLEGAHAALSDVGAVREVFKRVVEIGNSHLRAEYFHGGVTWQSLKSCFEATHLDAALVEKLQENFRNNRPNPFHNYV